MIAPIAVRPATMKDKGVVAVIIRHVIMNCVIMSCVIASCVAANTVNAQTVAWSPQKSVELIVPTAAGSSMDVLARLIQDLWQKNQLLATPLTVQPRPGGGGAIAWTYLSQKAGDGHYLAISGPTLLANDVLKIGNLKFQDLTPIAQLFTEYSVFAVNAGSRIANGNDLAQALTTAVPPSVAIAPGFGSSSHVALLRLAHAIGIDWRKLTIVPFKGANESVTAALGGHIDVVIATMSVLAPHLEAGKLRAIAVAAPKRLSGTYSSIATWQEQGHAVIEGNWRGVVGPKDLTQQQVAFWSGRLAEIVRTEEWANSLTRNSWDADFRIGTDAQHFLQTQYNELQSTLAVLGADFRGPM
jgi:putative tricarboxylic transport membrane protein